MSAMLVLIIGPRGLAGRGGPVGHVRLGGSSVCDICAERSNVLYSQASLEKHSAEGDAKLSDLGGFLDAQSAEKLFVNKVKMLTQTKISCHNTRLR